MTLVSITLSEEGQRLLLRHAGYYPDNGPWSEIAESIRKAQDTSPFEIHPPDENDGHARLEAMRRIEGLAAEHGFTGHWEKHCAECGRLDDDDHDDAVDMDHRWR